MGKTNPINPYLKSGRLADVIAAITALGTYRYYKLSYNGCAERISNDPNGGDRWGEIFSEHPEFFRTSAEEQRASLVWRRQHPKCYHPQRSIELSRDECDALTTAERSALSRRPLQPSEVTALITTAINLHERALEQSKASKWWVPLVPGGLAFIGSALGTLFSLYFRL